MHIHSAHSLQTFFKSELNELYLSMALRSFSFSLVGIIGSMVVVPFSTLLYNKTQAPLVYFLF